MKMSLDYDLIKLRAIAFVQTSLAVLVISVCVNICTASCMPVDSVLHQVGGLPVHIADVIAGVFVWMPATLWILWDGTRNRATFGMRRQELRFYRNDGAEVAWFLCLVRIVAGALALPLIPLSCIVALFDREHRTISDLICGTVISRQRIVSGWPVVAATDSP